MKVTWRPLVERFSASSDLEEKLVTSMSVGTLIVLINEPDGVI